MPRPPDPENCVLCERDRPLTFHHLIPRTLHKKRWVKVRFAADDLQDGVWLCRDCHDAVHRFIPHRELAEAFRSLDALRSHPEVAKFVSWIARQRGRRKVARPNP